jgi:large subunit ribosomal protein L25
MAEARLNVQTRTVTGNKVRKLRREKILPGVVYGRKYASQSVQFPQNVFEKVYRDYGSSHLIGVSVDGEKDLKCYIHDVDIHPVTMLPRHADFLVVEEDTEVKIEVPLEFVGEAPVVKNEGAVVVHNLDVLEVVGLPSQIPEKIEVDMSVLDSVDKSIHVGDLDLGGGKSVHEEKDVVASVSMPKEYEEEEASEEVVTEVVTGGDNTEEE